METQDLITYINSLVNYTYYAYSYPRNAADNCALVLIGDGMPMDQYTGVKRPAIQVLVRAEPYDIQAAEAKAKEIFEALANKEEVKIGSASISQIQTKGSAPFYIGADENDRPQFSMNFIAVVKP